MRKPVAILAALILALAVGYAIFRGPTANQPGPAEVGNDAPATEQPVIVTSPSIDAVVGSPLRVEGQARGAWYFEASFPLEILDANGKMLGQSYAQAQSDWMTEGMVPFVGTIAFSAPTTATGTLVLRKDNPSGLPEHDAEMRVPVTFAAATRAVKLFYYSAPADKDAGGNPRCLATSVKAVSRAVPSTQTPIQDAIRLLLQGAVTNDERESGLSTEFPLPGVELKGASLKAGVLTLEFSDAQHKTSGGACRASILAGQIEATAKQFPEVKSVRIIPDELFQP